LPDKGRPAFLTLKLCRGVFQCFVSPWRPFNGMCG